MDAFNTDYIGGIAIAGGIHGRLI